MQDDGKGIQTHDAWMEVSTGYSRGGEIGGVARLAKRILGNAKADARQAPNSWPIRNQRGSDCCRKTGEMKPNGPLRRASTPPETGEKR
jgi:hypothetical protein